MSWLKKKLKRAIKNTPFLFKRMERFLTARELYTRQHRGKVQKNGFFVKTCRLIKFGLRSFGKNIVDGRTPFQMANRLLNRVSINDCGTDYFYTLDENISYVTKYGRSIIGNLTPDYTILLDNSLQEIMSKSSGDFRILWSSVYDYLNRCLKFCSINTPKYKALCSIRDDKTKSFFDALQRILFVNMLCWQEGHGLIGLGRLDKLLYPYYEKDVELGIIDSHTTLKLIKSFLITLHEHFSYKSSTFLGDTGQIIILGGENADESYTCNALTSLFIRAVKELQLPDPKVLLRISDKTPDSIMKESLECIQTGIGCPLFANDTVILPKLEKFGYKKEDIFDYGTSACWEPLLIGKSSDANNVNSINFCEPFAKEELWNEKISSFEEFVLKYENLLDAQIRAIIEDVAKVQWQRAPILSLFIQGCEQNGKDISENGAIYNGYGFTTVAIGNAVNGLLNIKEFIFDKKVLPLHDLYRILLDDFKNRQDIQKLFKNRTEKYGSDNSLVKELSSRLFKKASEVIKINNVGDRKIKIGLSSPAYISSAINFPATPDGRNASSSFIVHISNDSAENFTSLFNFASSMDYDDNRFNGNVVDFMVSPSFIEHNFDTFLNMLKNAFKSGVFEMQMNVVSAKTLIEANAHPEKFPNLIVRVWGFSAYFNDLPDDYKKILIERALEHERTVA